MTVERATYRLFCAEVLQFRREAEARFRRPAGVLELASGSGGFAFALDALAGRRGVRVDITASDIVPLYVERGQARAAKEGGRVTFRHLDALDMQSLDDGAFDVVFLAQSTHHFSPGQLPRLIAEPRAVATTAFVS